MNSAHVDMEKTVYIKAASIVTEYVESRQLQPSVPEEDVFAAYKWFQELFSPEKLKRRAPSIRSGERPAARRTWLPLFFAFDEQAEPVET